MTQSGGNTEVSADLTVTRAGEQPVEVEVTTPAAENEPAQGDPPTENSESESGEVVRENPPEEPVEGGIIQGGEGDE